VQTTHKIQGGDADKYASYLTSESERGDYYIDPQDKSGEGAAGEWHGAPSVLASLGLSPERPVERDQLLALMNGEAPSDGREIRAAGGNGTKVAGIDMSFSPPKEVSALWAISGPERRAQIEQAHKGAVSSAMGYVERDVELVRVREAGQLKWETANSLVGAKFVHNTSRLTATQEKNGVPDPQLHTHVVVLAAERHDGKFAAVDSRQVFLSARENGAWYRSALAQNLQALGLQVEKGTGKDSRYFAVRGVPKGLAEKWSTRSADIRQAARDFREQYGREPNARELASLTTESRGTKSTMAAEKTEDAWRETAAEHGLTREQAEGLFNEREQSPTSEPPSPSFTQELVGKVTEKSSIVSERELYATAYELSAGVCHPSEAQELVRDLAREGELVELEGGMWTTRDLREREQQTMETVRERAAEVAAPVSKQSLRDAEREVEREIGGPLSNEQREALQTITGEGGVSALVGQAGTGKGVVLSAATSAWQKEGYQVIGTAVAGATAERLGADAKTDKTMTTDALLYRVEQERVNLDKSTVVVMDEAGMADTDRVSRLAEVTGRSEAKLVLVGDGAQLSPIGAGGLFGHIAKEAPKAKLGEVRRAENEWERKAWGQLREGKATAALAAYQEHDRLHVEDTREQAGARMVADWNEQRLEQPEGRTVMLTDASNEELDRLNMQAQEYREREGELGNDRAKLPDRPYDLAEGDQVIFTKAYYQQGQERVENGTLGIVKEVRGEHSVSVDTLGAKQREVGIDTSEFKELRLGYAQHVYKAQGLTANNALALIGGWQTDRERAYVALTRGREQTNIYTSRENLGNQGMNPEAIKRLAEKMGQSKAQEASISREQATDRSLERPAEQATETAMEAGLGRTAERQPETAANHESDRDREPQELPHEQPSTEHDAERDHSIGLGIE
jgi:conjugative relaxase-like TrwC/TraI family protein